MCVPGKIQVVGKAISYFEQPGEKAQKLVMVKNLVPSENTQLTIIS